MNEIDRSRAFETRIIAGQYSFAHLQFSFIKFFAFAKKIRAYRLRGMPPSDHKPHSTREKSRVDTRTLIPAYDAYGRNTISVIRRVLIPYTLNTYDYGT